MFPGAEKITSVQDNLNAHKKSAFYELFPPERVFTPKHGSWLNITEIELSAPARRGLERRIATKEELINQCDEQRVM